MNTMTSAVANPDLIAWLQTSAAYPHRPQLVERLETHISHVFLADDYVYKLKKAVEFAFLDFSTPAARERACREEVRLNRRLAPHVYLGVVPVIRDGKADFRLGADGQADGEVVDWLVQMQRLPQERMLDVLVRHGQLLPQQIDQVADLLATFYSNAARPRLSPEQYRERFVAHVHENRDSLLAALPAAASVVVHRSHAFQLQLLHLCPELFDRRVEMGWIVEGHGDLRAEHICLTEPIAIFDCIEFSEEFRRLDVADELAFLAAECDFLGAEWVGPHLLGRFGELSGDHPPQELLDFYKTYRACVRAKVAALRAAQLADRDQEQEVSEAMAHLKFADEYAAPYLRPLVVVVGGLSGSGKTTLARRISQELSAPLLSSDVVRQELLGPSRDAQPIDGGKYAPEQRERVYQELFHRARQLQQQQLSVVLDATFADQTDLQAAFDLSRERHADFLAVECHCPREVALERIAHRLNAGQDASEAHAEVYDQQFHARTPWPKLVPQVRVDTVQPLENQWHEVVEALKCAGIAPAITDGE